MAHKPLSVFWVKRDKKGFFFRVKTGLIKWTSLSLNIGFIAAKTQKHSIKLRHIFPKIEIFNAWDFEKSAILAYSHLVEKTKTPSFR